MKEEFTTIFETSFTKEHFTDRVNRIDNLQHGNSHFKHSRIVEHDENHVVIEFDEDGQVGQDHWVLDDLICDIAEIFYIDYGLMMWTMDNDRQLTFVSAQ